MITLYNGTEGRFLAFERSLNIEKEKFPRVEVYDFSQGSEYQEFFDALLTSSLFGELKLVIGKRLDKIKKMAEFIAQIERVAHTQNCVLLEGEGALFTAKQREKIDKSIKVIECKEKTLASLFVNEACSILGCERGDAERILSILPENYYTYQNEISKLALYFNGKKFNYDDAVKLVTYREQEIFFYIERFFQNMELKALYEFVEREKQYMLLIALLTDEVLMYKILKSYEREKNLLLSQQNYSQFSKTHAPHLTQLYYKHPYAYFKKLEMLDKVSFDFIDFALDAIIECEISIKSGKMSDSIATFQLLRQLQKKF